VSDAPRHATAGSAAALCGQQTGRRAPCSVYHPWFTASQFVLVRNPSAAFTWIAGAPGHQPMLIFSRWLIRSQVVEIFFFGLILIAGPSWVMDELGRVDGLRVGKCLQG